MTDVMGWRLDDTVALIRGAADSVVRLDVLPADAGPDGKHKQVTLVRKRIRLEEQAAKKSVLIVGEGRDTRRVGVISLPTFYEDFAARQKGEQDFRSATRDVARLLVELKKEQVDGVLVDLRNNGGGSLKEAVELTGLFVGKGPVVQQRDARGRLTVESDTKAGVSWDGPLGVLMNRGSASASEIFAAAIQDYGRGLLIGEPSFGKGTVQTMLSLDQIAKNDKQKFGDLKFTVAQFFRINGGTTQLRGVSPDILFPSAADADSSGESSFDNALPWLQIKPVDYALAGDLKSLFPLLQQRHEARVKSDREFQDLQEDVAEFRRLRKKTQISLNEAERRQERDLQEARLKAREARRDSAKDSGPASAPGKSRVIRDDGLQADERNVARELADEKAGANNRDVLLTEAVNILADEVALLKPAARFAARAKPDSAAPADQERASGAARSGVW
jgi:carboxyl-terminal processing protease